MQEAEEAAAAKAAKLEAQQAAAAAAANPEIAKSPSDFSCHSYELFVGQEKGNDDNNKEKMSIRSEGLESVSEITRTTAPTATAAGTAKARKVSAVSMLPLCCTITFTRSSNYYYYYYYYYYIDGTIELRYDLDTLKIPDHSTSLPSLLNASATHSWQNTVNEIILEPSIGL
uniref:Uncharacterized protein n=1 Tax=Anopheles maculatus TaxID=74869 RepID=A0A182SS54_9DIPT